MLESFWFSVFVGTILGALAGLGVGGGSLLMLWLTVVIGMEHGQARGINLLFFLPAAGISTLLRWKQGQLCIRRLRSRFAWLLSGLSDGAGAAPEDIWGAAAGDRTAGAVLQAPLPESQVAFQDQRCCHGIHCLLALLSMIVVLG